MFLHYKFSHTDKVSDCIDYLETGLRSIKPTPYHKILGKTFLPLLAEATEYLVSFFRSASQQVVLKAINFEMNGFALNPDRWFCDGFGYKNYGDVYDLDWLADWEAETEELFDLPGLEPVQQVYADNFRKPSQPLQFQLAGELTEYLVLCRFAELIQAAHKKAKRSEPKLKDFPVLATAHDFDCVFESR